MTESIGPLEMQEYLFSVNMERAIRANPEYNGLRNLRECFRQHRFAVMGWLMLNGVTIPAELLDDRTHPEEGKQEPDRPISWKLS